MYSKAYDFVISIAEPVNRAHFIHEYRISTYSLYAAVSLGLDTQGIITALNRLSKVPLDKEVAQFVADHTEKYGKVKLVLHENKYYVEAAERADIETLSRDKDLAACMVTNSAEEMTIDKVTPKFGRDDRDDAEGGVKEEGEEEEEDVWADQESQGNVFRMQIHGNRVRDVKRRCADLRLPVLEEYDFRNDKKNPSLKIQLKPTVCVRNYQAKSLSKMFGGGRARSGMIVSFPSPNPKPEP